jgi:hypothetical protein
VKRNTTQRRTDGRHLEASGGLVSFGGVAMAGDCGADVLSLEGEVRGLERGEAEVEAMREFMQLGVRQPSLHSHRSTSP